MPGVLDRVAFYREQSDRGLLAKWPVQHALHVLTQSSQITTGPHPFISHANDAVREYILSRLEPLAARHGYIHISDDTVSNVTYVRGGEYAVYFEGNNVLLKIDGTEPASDGVLFSCHFDSVSSAPGATDDGMAVATLLQMAEYLSAKERRPRRTAVFFFNNGEEDGLNGAHAYFEHPWSNLTSVFINLEGAAAGGWVSSASTAPLY